MQQTKEQYRALYLGQNVFCCKSWPTSQFRHPLYLTPIMLDYESNWYLSLRHIGQLTDDELMHISFLCNMPINKVVNWKKETLSSIDCFKNGKLITITLNGAKELIDYLISIGINLSETALQNGWCVLREDKV